MGGLDHVSNYLDVLFTRQSSEYISHDYIYRFIGGPATERSSDEAMRQRHEASFDLSPLVFSIETRHIVRQNFLIVKWTVH